ncbi:MAG: tyrosine/phenylalanine carboxypeptidase domain-containing protein [Polyangiales bacterium]
MNRHEKLLELSHLLRKPARKVRVLSAISWPLSVADNFLASWHRGNPIAPAPIGDVKRASKLEAEFSSIIGKCDREDPIGRYLADTAGSYRTAVQLLAHTGTKRFFELSCDLYGSSGGTLRGSELTHREAADNILLATDEMAQLRQPPDYCVTAEGVATEMKKEWRGFFEKPMRFVVDENLSAKAAASSMRVRLRKGTCFTVDDAAQLSAHEVGVHSLTARNGARQPIVPALGLGAPRTTATQEGIATFAELVTGTIDLARLRRLALRVRAIALVEEGADFIELFRSLLDSGEPEREAVFTAMRIFRGADPAGGAPFTKDVVYLRGLFAVHTFLRKAISERRPELVGALFVGRLTLGDVMAFESEMGTTVSPPRYLPRWATRLPSLAAFLSFSALMNSVDLGRVTLGDDYA